MTHLGKIEMRAMEKRDLQTVLCMVNAEGWNYHISELIRILEVSPETSITVCSGDEIVGAITVAVTGTRSVPAHVVIRPEWRNRGIGSKMLEAAERRSTEKGAELIELYAVKDAMAFYHRHGYRDVEEIHTYESKNENPPKITGNYEFKVLTKSDVPEMKSLDRKATGFERGRIIDVLMHDFPGSSLGLYKNGKMSGFVMGRTTEVMSDIGPWTMEDPDFDSGLAMISKLLNIFPRNRLALSGISGNNAIARDVFVALGFERHNVQIRVVKSRLTVPPFTKGFMSLSAFEFG